MGSSAADQSEEHALLLRHEKPLVKKEKAGCCECCTQCLKHPVCLKLSDFIYKNFLPISLITAVVFGALVPKPGAALASEAVQYVCLGGIFICSGLYLKTEALVAALKSYRAYIWGFASILFVSVIIGVKLIAIFPFAPKLPVFPTNGSANSTFGTPVTPGDDHFVVGPYEFGLALQIFFAMPCTITTSVIMVAALDGNYALAIFLTTACNVIGIFTVPPMLGWLVNIAGTKIKFNIGILLLKMCLSLLVPLAVGKLLRYVKIVRDFCEKWSKPIKLMAILCLVMIIWTTVSKTSASGNLKQISVARVLAIIGIASAVHSLYLVMNALAGLALWLPVSDIKCLCILCSQKTVSISIAVVAFLPPSVGDHGLMAVPMVLAHLTITVFDAILIPIWLKIESLRRGPYKIMVESPEEPEKVPESQPLRKTPGTYGATA